MRAASAAPAAAPPPPPPPPPPLPSPPPPPPACVQRRLEAERLKELARLEREHLELLTRLPKGFEEHWTNGEEDPTEGIMYATRLGPTALRIARPTPLPPPHPPSIPLQSAAPLLLLTPLLLLLCDCTGTTTTRRRWASRCGAPQISPEDEQVTTRPSSAARTSTSSWRGRPTSTRSPSTSLPPPVQPDDRGRAPPPARTSTSSWLGTPIWTRSPTHEPTTARRDPPRAADASPPPHPQAAAGCAEGDGGGRLAVLRGGEGGARQAPQLGVGRGGRRARRARRRRLPLNPHTDSWLEALPDGLPLSKFVMHVDP